MNELIIRARDKSKLNREELAQKLNISSSMVLKVENGIRRPSPNLAKKWAKVLHIPESKIFKYFFDYKPDNMC